MRSTCGYEYDYNSNCTNKNNSVLIIVSKLFVLRVLKPD